jgi:hypothetical protein
MVKINNNKLNNKIQPIIKPKLTMKIILMFNIHHNSTLMEQSIILNKLKKKKISYLLYKLDS